MTILAAFFLGVLAAILMLFAALVVLSSDENLVESQRPKRRPAVARGLSDPLVEEQQFSSFMSEDSLLEQHLLYEISHTFKAQHSVAPAISHSSGFIGAQKSPYVSRPMVIASTVFLVASRQPRSTGEAEEDENSGSGRTDFRAVQAYRNDKPRFD